MPVLPLVGSTIMVSTPILPARSAASIIARPMRSLTLESGLKNSHLANTVACPAGISRLMRTSGVPPMVSVMFSKIRPWGFIAIFCSLNPRPAHPAASIVHSTNPASSPSSSSIQARNTGPSPARPTIRYTVRGHASPRSTPLGTGSLAG